MFLTPAAGFDDAYVAIGRKFDGVKLVRGLMRISPSTNSTAQASGGIVPLGCSSGEVDTKVNCVSDSQARNSKTRPERKTHVESDLTYFRRRASEERTAALQARKSVARNAHLEFAERYEDLVRAIAERERQLGLNSYSATAPSEYYD